MKLQVGDNNMLDTLIVILLVWLLISIPIGLFIARSISLGKNAPRVEDTLHPTHNKNSESAPTIKKEQTPTTTD